MVQVVWLDSHVFGGWKSITEWRATFSRDRLVCQSVGWAIVEDEDYIVLAQTRGNPVSEESWADMVQIPRVALVSVTPLILAGGN
jgi:hypothetical protein